MPEDTGLLPKAQRIKIEERCDQVSAVSFNSQSYDLNLIKERFAQRLANTTGKIRVAKKGEKVIFQLTNGFRHPFECTCAKSWFPYE